jgi:hypothetical protein
MSAIPAPLVEFPVAITDPRAPRDPSAYEAFLDRLALPYLKDPRDVVFTRLAGRIVARVWPFALLLYVLPYWAVGLLAIPYIAHLFASFGGPMVLMLHCVTHRPIFKRAKFMDKFITHVLPPFFGMTPGAYHSHHVLMHHVENCSEDDVSGTAFYQRDNPLHFLHYWARFTFLGYYHMTSWLWRRGKTKALRSMILVELLAFGTIGALLWLNPAATTVVFVIPWMMLRYFLMAGNWTEHAFIDVADPTNDWKNSTCLVNTRYNHNCFNSGYHLMHHRSPGLHWSENVDFFKKNLDKLTAEDSIVFNGVVNNQQIWWKLMMKDYGFLADHLVDLGNRRPTREAKIAFLKERVQKPTGPWKGLFELSEARTQAAVSPA